MTNTNRVPAGSLEGGQWTANSRPESEMTLDDDYLLPMDGDGDNGAIKTSAFAALLDDDALTRTVSSIAGRDVSRAELEAALNSGDGTVNSFASQYTEDQSSSLRRAMLADSLADQLPERTPEQKVEDYIAAQTRGWNDDTAAREGEKIRAALDTLPDDEARMIAIDPSLRDDRFNIDPPIHERVNLARSAHELGYEPSEGNIFKRYGQYQGAPAIVARAADERGLTLPHSAYMSDALRNGDPEALAAKVRDPKTTTLADLVEAHSPENADRLRRGLAAGLDVRAIEEGHDDLERQAEVYAAMGDRHKIDATEAFERGHTGETVKAYGPAMSRSFSPEELENSGLKPATIRSMASALNYHTPTSPKGLKVMHDAGLTNGKQIRALAKVATPNATSDTLIEYAKQAPTETLDRYRVAARGNSRDPLSLDEARHVGRLSRAGYDDPVKLSSLIGPGFESESRRASRNSTKSALEVYADLAESGKSTERINTLSRAGVPPEHIAEVSDDTDAWEAGAPYRGEYERVTSRAWPHTREDVR